MRDFYQWFEDLNNQDNQMPQPQRYAINLPLPDGAQIIIKLYRDAGFEIHPVGGAIRNFALGRPVKDYDLATNATGDQSNTLLKGAGYQTNETGKNFGVIRVRAGTPEKPGQLPPEYEIASYRQDVGIGRKPGVVQIRDRGVDAQRRDFTVNAMYYDPETSEAIDHVGGWDDLQKRIIRAVGNPWERFNEDPLRVLRYIRFHNDIGQGTMDTIIDDDHRQALQHFISNGLTSSNDEQVAPERIAQEFDKGLSQAQDLGTYLQLYNDLGAFKTLVFPGLNVDLEEFPKVNLQDRKIMPDGTKGFLKATTLGPLFASILFDNEASKVGAVLRNRKYENDVIDAVTFLIGITPGSGSQGPKLDRETLKRDPEWFGGLLARYTRKALALQRAVPPRTLIEWAEYKGMDVPLVEAFANYQWKTLSQFMSPEQMQAVPAAQRMEKEKQINYRLFMQQINSPERND